MIEFHVETLLLPEDSIDFRFDQRLKLLCFYFSVQNPILHLIQDHIFTFVLLKYSFYLRQTRVNLDLLVL